VALGLLLLVAATFAPMLSHQWLAYDDDLYVTANPSVALGWSSEGITWAFTTLHGANWFPLTWLSWMLDYAIHGPEAGAFLATNLVLHAAATVVLFLALRRMTGEVGPSAFVAAVFGVHPLHVESVAWVAARKDPLSGLFFACVLLVWAGCKGRNASGGRIAVAAVLLLLGLLAKQTLVTLPFVLLLLDAWPLRRLEPAAGGGTVLGFDAAALRRAVVEKWPLFALVAAFSAVAVVAQRSAGAVAKLGDLSLGERLSNAVVAAATYVELAFWPRGLAVFYPHPGGSLAAWKVGVALAALSALTLLCLRAWQRVPALAVGWLWFLGTLAPVIGIVQVGSQARADRYTYLPLVGLAIAVAWGVPEAARAWLPAQRVRRRVLLVAGLGATAALALASVAQLRHWRDTATLMRRALAVTEDNHIAHAYLGVALLQEGRVEDAVLHWRESAQLRPDFLTVLNNLAWLLATHPDPRQRNPGDAIRYAEQARLEAGDDPAVLDTLAAAYASAGRFDAARREARRAAEIAESQPDPALAGGILSRLALYDRDRPYIER